MGFHLDVIELIGFIGTLFILLAFTRDDTNQIRLVNSIGSVLFVIYGVMIGSLSVAILNGACLGVNIWKVCKSNQEMIPAKSEEASEMLPMPVTIFEAPNLDVKKVRVVKKQK